jgi:hypothetical protein
MSLPLPRGDHIWLIMGAIAYDSGNPRRRANGTAARWRFHPSDRPTSVTGRIVVASLMRDIEDSSYERRDVLLSDLCALRGRADRLRISEADCPPTCSVLSVA